MEDTFYLEGILLLLYIARYIGIGMIDNGV